MLMTELQIKSLPVSLATSHAWVVPQKPTATSAETKTNEAIKTSSTRTPKNAPRVAPTSDFSCLSLTKHVILAMKIATGACPIYTSMKIRAGTNARQKQPRVRRTARSREIIIKRKWSVWIHLLL